MAMRSNDRILILEKIDKEKKNHSLVDPKTLEGKNPLHIYMEQGMWYFRYEHGLVPGPLRDRYTSFKVAKDAAEAYFLNNNIRIVDVIDDA